MPKNISCAKNHFYGSIKKTIVCKIANYNYKTLIKKNAMKKQILIIASLIGVLKSNVSYAQFIGSAATAPANVTTPNNIGIGTTGATNAKLEILGTTNQLRLSNTSTKFTDINTTSIGDLTLYPNNAGVLGRIGLGIPTPQVTQPATGFHCNMGVFRISDNASATKALQISPNFAANGEIPSGVALLTPIATSGEGLSFLPTGGTTAGVKLGAYAYSSIGWRSIWETANVNGLGHLPNLLLVRNAGNVGIGTGATLPAAKLDVIGQVKITDGTQGLNKVLTSDANGLASWTTLTGILSGGNANYLPKWTSNNTLSSTSLIYDNGTNVGIGTNIPYKKLSVIGDVSFGSNNGNSSFEIVGNGVIPSRRGISIDNDPSGKFNFYIHSWQTDAGFYFKDGNGDKTLVSINSDGYMKIGNQNILAPHTNAHLAVSGKIVCQSLYVLKPTSWADFVFKKNDIESLKNVEIYINEHKHLPGIPSEEEIKTNGYNINEMDAKLLEKIETLYLHIIALEKEVEQLKNK